VPKLNFNWKNNIMSLTTLLLVVLTFSVIFLVFGINLLYKNLPVYLPRRRLTQNGVQAQAQVLKLGKQLGGVSRETASVGFFATYRFEVPGQAQAYEKTEAIGYLLSKKLVENQTVPVLYLASDPQNTVQLLENDDRAKAAAKEVRSSVMVIAVSGIITIVGLLVAVSR
jgi:hypothetical protein